MPGERPSFIPPENPFSSSEGKFPPEPTEKFVERYLGKRGGAKQKPEQSADESLQLSESEKREFDRSVRLAEASQTLSTVDPLVTRLLETKIDPQSPTGKMMAEWHRDSLLAWYADSTALAGNVPRSEEVVRRITSPELQAQVYLAQAKFQATERVDPDRALKLAVKFAFKSGNYESGPEIFEEAARIYAAGGNHKAALAAVQKLRPAEYRLRAYMKVAEAEGVPADQRFAYVQELAKQGYPKRADHVEAILELEKYLYRAGAVADAVFEAASHGAAEVRDPAERTRLFLGISERLQNSGRPSDREVDAALQAAKQLVRPHLRLEALAKVGYQFVEVERDVDDVIAAMRSAKQEVKNPSYDYDYEVAKLQLRAAKLDEALPYIESGLPSHKRDDIAPLLLHELVYADRIEEAVEFVRNTQSEYDRGKVTTELLKQMGEWGHGEEAVELWQTLEPRPDPRVLGEAIAVSMYSSGLDKLLPLLDDRTQRNVRQKAVERMIEGRTAEVAVLHYVDQEPLDAQRAYLLAKLAAMKDLSNDRAAELVQRAERLLKQTTSVVSPQGEFSAYIALCQAAQVHELDGERHLESALRALKSSTKTEFRAVQELCEAARDLHAVDFLLKTARESTWNDQQRREFEGFAIAAACKRAQATLAPLYAAHA